MLYLNCGPQSVNWASDPPVESAYVTATKTIYYNFAPVFTKSKIEVFTDPKYQISRTVEQTKLLVLVSGAGLLNKALLLWYHI